jgi:hypothetical protein
MLSILAHLRSLHLKLSRWYAKMNAGLALDISEC